MVFRFIFAAMLSINSLSYFLGDRALYNNASLHIKPKDKIGLIGLNGTGKSTLLRLINNEYQADEGDIQKSNDCTIGFLNQDLLSYQTDDSILSVAMEAFADALHIQKQIDEVLKQMETNYEDQLVDKLTKLQERFEALEGYSLQSKAEEILEGIGFNTKDLKRPLREFSGGWRMRVMLAKLLLEKPSLLMLDEPTNHLDLPSIQWIENYLKTYEGAVIVVSHDREFLNNTVTSIVEVTGAQLVQYSGNYNFYLEEKELRNELQKNAFENQQQKIKQTERFIERFKAKATKARQVQSRVKSLERMDIVEDVLEENATVNFKFNFQQKSGRHVVTMLDVTKAYGELEILRDSTGRIERGDKVALIGANGKGKSTLLRIIAGTEPIDGDVEIGHNVNFGFYAQHQLEALNVQNELLEELKQAGTGKTEQELRSVLGCFLFRDEEVFKKIKVLSGGEKSRVALAKTLISESNFLLLDEPTNHLDMQSVNILIQALQQYEGTFIVVSHDRHFVNRIANKIWWIEDQELKEYPGSYEEFNWWKSQQDAGKVVEQPAKKEKTGPKKQKPKTQEDPAIKQLKKQIVTVEQQITVCEESIASLEEWLNKPDAYGNETEFLENSEKLAAARSELETLTAEWESLVEQTEG